MTIVGKIRTQKEAAMHTKGPWTVEDGTYVFAANTLRVADCECDGQTMKLKEAKANATLIAAAPELLAVVRAYHTTYPLDDYSNLVHDLIAKAEGRVRP